MKLATFIMVAFVPTAFSQIVYDINFQTPNQPVNQIVHTGPAPNYVSRVLFGTPMVVNSYGSLTDQPLLFSGTSLIELSMQPTKAQILDLSFDLVDLGQNHSFSVLVGTDTPSFQFREGQISLVQTPSQQSIGSYQLGTSYRINVHFDYRSNLWSFRRNDTLLAQGNFGYWSDFAESIQFGYSAGASNVAGTAIDNITVAVPEPSLFMFGGLGLLWLLNRRAHGFQRSEPCMEQKPNAQIIA